MREIGAAEFKARCLNEMERVRRTRQEVVVTKRGVPFVKVVPLPPAKPFKLGALADRCEIVGDITEPVYTDEEWAAFEREKLERFLNAPIRRRVAPLRKRRRS